MQLNVSCEFVNWNLKQSQQEDITFTIDITVERTNRDPFQANAVLWSVLFSSDVGWPSWE